MSPIYEVVSGLVLLSRRGLFFKLHSEQLLPIMRQIGIRPKLMLMTEIGMYGRFLDIYQYENLAEYEKLTDRLVGHPLLASYYDQVGECVQGSITVEIMRDLPYANDWMTS